jgi:hypothetical protein
MRRNQSWVLARLADRKSKRQVLMNVMRKADFVAPSDWEGFRALTSK